MRTLTRTLRIPAKFDENTNKILVETMKEYSKAVQMGYNYGLSHKVKGKLKVSSGRERRFQKDMNHCITKDIIFKIPANSTIILEDLSFIRKTAKRRRKTRSNREFHSWAFYQFQMFLEYKAAEKNIEVVYVDPRYTSQQCSVCGFISRGNRVGANFLCKGCNFSLNADLNASHNIKSRIVDTSYLLQLAR